MREITRSAWPLRHPLILGDLISYQNDRKAARWPLARSQERRVRIPLHA